MTYFISWHDIKIDIKLEMCSTVLTAAMKFTTQLHLVPRLPMRGALYIPATLLQGKNTGIHSMVSKFFLALSRFSSDPFYIY
jgi:hypothetical protein